MNCKIETTNQYDTWKVTSIDDDGTDIEVRHLNTLNLISLVISIKKMGDDNGEFFTSTNKNQ